MTSRRNEQEQRRQLPRATAESSEIADEVNTRKDDDIQREESGTFVCSEKGAERIHIIEEENEEEDYVVIDEALSLLKDVRTDLDKSSSGGNPSRHACRIFIFITCALFGFKLAGHLARLAVGATDPILPPALSGKELDLDSPSWSPTSQPVEFRSYVPSSSQQSTPAPTSKRMRYTAAPTLVQSSVSDNSDKVDMSAPAKTLDTYAAFKQCLASQSWKELPKLHFAARHPWAVDLFVHGSEKNMKTPELRVMYQLIPKAGSTAIREVFSETYGYIDADGKPWHMGNGDGSSDIFKNHAIAKKYEGFYKFSLVTDPLQHFVAGAMQADIRYQNKPAFKDFKSWSPGQVPPAGLVEYVNRIVRSTAEDMRAFLQGTKPKSKSKGVNVHLAPQTWLLRAAREHSGVELDYVGRLSQAGWERLIKDMVSKGYKAPPRDALAAQKSTRMGGGSGSSSSWSYSDVIPLLNQDVLQTLCTILVDEYQCLGFEMPNFCV